MNNVVKKVPLRKCTGCGEMKPKKDLARVIKTSENEILLDKTGKKNGRGAYICFSVECIDKAMKSKGLERSLQTRIPNEIYEELKREMQDNE